MDLKYNETTKSIVIEIPSVIYLEKIPPPSEPSNKESSKNIPKSQSLR